jgi:hypothetical protein
VPRAASWASSWATRRTWATPLQTLLLAERAALLSGRDEDLTMILTIGYTGLRWGEAIGLERDFVRGSEMDVEWQLREINGMLLAPSGTEQVIDQAGI